ncbi:MAG: hypothetical protein QOD84_3022 [Acidobacteriaceae bacterium]|jgi:hypothetical protein
MQEDQNVFKPEAGQPSNPRQLQTLLTVIVVIAALAAAYFLGARKRTSQLDGFAKCLQTKNAKTYGIYWCTHCAEQKELFGSAFQYIPYIECGIKGSRDEALRCVQANVKQFPTWQFADGSRTQGTLPLSALSEKTGCALP